MIAAENPTETPEPKGLRQEVNRVGRQNKTLRRENQALRRIVLAQATKDLDLDPAEAIDLIENYRPVWSEDFEQSFASDAIHHFIAARRLP